MDIVFEDPPEPSNGRKGKWVEIGDRLRERPGEWAVVANGSTGIASQINKGRYKLGPGKFQAVSRTIDGRTTVYARYVGGES